MKEDRTLRDRLAKIISPAQARGDSQTKLTELVDLCGPTTIGRQKMEADRKCLKTTRKENGEAGMHRTTIQARSRQGIKKRKARIH
jgi:hypothetical protein